MGSPCSPAMCCACHVMHAIRSCTHRPLHSVCVGAGIREDDILFNRLSPDADGECLAEKPGEAC